MAADFNNIHPRVAERFRGYPAENLWYLLIDFNRSFMGPGCFDKPNKQEEVAARQTIWGVDLDEFEEELDEQRPDEQERDGDKQGEQQQGEREVGYLSGMFSGFNYVLATIDEPLSRDYLRNLHQYAVSQTVQNNFGGDYRDPLVRNLQLSMRNRGVITSGLTVVGLRRNVTFQGLKELRAKIRGGDNYFRIMLNHSKDDCYLMVFQLDHQIKSGFCPRGSEEELRGHQEAVNTALEILKKDDLTDEQLYDRIKKEDSAVIIRFACSQVEMFARIDNIINVFHTSMAAQGISEAEKIRAIATCLHEILLTHPFSDGNGRTMALLLNKLLLQYNCSPSILDNPTIIDAFSIEGICNKIREGQRTFECYKHIPYSREGEVIFLKGNPNVAVLFVDTAMAPIRNVDRINISDRQEAMNLFLGELEQIDSMDAQQIMAKRKDIFVYTALMSLPHWNEINVGDRQGTLNLFLRELQQTNFMSARQMETKMEEIKDRVSAAIYKRGHFDFFSNRDSLVSEVTRSAISGRVGKAIHMVWQGNQYGINFSVLAANNNRNQNNHAVSPLSCRP